VENVGRSTRLILASPIFRKKRAARTGSMPVPFLANTHMNIASVTTEEISEKKPEPNPPEKRARKAEKPWTMTHPPLPRLTPPTTPQPVSLCCIILSYNIIIRIEDTQPILLLWLGLDSPHISSRRLRSRESSIRSRRRLWE
jgi:hypothetical protein